MQMITYIAQSIKRAEDRNGTGANIYTGYFITNTFYAEYRSAVDSILIVDNYAQCIVVG